MKGRPVATNNEPVVVTTTEDGTEPVAPVGPSVEDGTTEPEKVYNETYVQSLKDEAAAARVKAKRAEDAETRLRELSIAQAVQGILTDSTDLGWSDEYADEHGWPDADKIRTAAEELVDRKPHLGRPSGDVGQGRHTEQDGAVSLTGLLRAGA